MHILMLDQYFTTAGGGLGKRFFEIGRRLVEQGHQVTVISGNSELELSLGKNKIGLLQQDGMAVVAFNLDGKRKGEAGARERRRASSAFARLAGRQGRRLPRPDMVLAASPPLSTSKSALSLSRYYGVPLVMDIREAEPALNQPGVGVRGLLLTSSARRLALQTFRFSKAIITTGEEIAALIKENVPEHGRIVVIPENAGGEELFKHFIKLLPDQILS